MKIGPRITITTVSLVVLTLGMYATVSVRNRRAELQADSARRLSTLGGMARVTIEAALKDGLFEDLGSLVARWQTTEPEIRFTYIDLERQRGVPRAGFQVAGPVDGSVPDLAPSTATVEQGGEAVSVGGQAIYLPPSRDPTRQLRLHRAVVEGLPYGEHVEIEGRPVYAVMEPIRDGDGRLVGALELVRNEDETQRALGDSTANVVYAVGGLAVMLMVLVWLLATGGIARPVTRLVEAVDDVTRGDLGRVILRERDDEIGDLAERFNEMTGSLREARREILDGVDAKLSLEARLRHSEKLATIGQLAAGIAHEVGTPLNVIGGRARNMEKRADEALRPDGQALQPADVAKQAGIIAAQSQRITKIIQQLLDFARRPQRERERVDLSRVCRDALDFLEHQLEQAHVEALQVPFVREDSVVDAPPPPASPFVTGDPDQLQQVCLNLCVNALQAMPQGGRLTVSLRGTTRRRPGLDAAPMGRYVVLSIADTGVGIPEADRERIFEPFYSTKPPTEDDPGGTGLGLAVSNGIVKDHDGWIQIEAPAAGGTIFHVYVPADG
jgi:signal transduction histidine kinase